MKDLKGLMQMLTYGNRYGRKGNNRKTTRGRKAYYQKVTDEPTKVLKERYLPGSALKKIATGIITKKQAMKTLAKNRYTVNSNAKILKTIKHYEY